jgi:hypothetical protein
MNTEVSNSETTLAIGSDVTNLNQLMSMSEGLEKLTPVMTLTADYIEMVNVGDKFRGVYIGVGEINVTDKATGELKPLVCARFIVDKQVKINAGVNLVRELKNVPQGTPIEVEFSKKDGNVKIYSITLLG